MKIKSTFWEKDKKEIIPKIDQLFVFLSIISIATIITAWIQQRFFILTMQTITLIVLQAGSMSISKYYKNKGA